MHPSMHICAYNDSMLNPKEVIEGEGMLRSRMLRRRFLLRQLLWRLTYYVVRVGPENPYRAKKSPGR